MRLPLWTRRRGSGVWSDWPDEAYEQAGYQQRLTAVQTHLSECIATAPAGQLRVLGMCAGDGRDVIGVLESHPRRDEVYSTLVELNDKSVASGIRQAKIAGLQHSVQFLNDDATAYATYQLVAPADIVLACGVWGHVPCDDRESLVQGMARLCKPFGAVIWTRGISRGMARLRDILDLFANSDWQQARLSLTEDDKWAVVTHQYRGPHCALPEEGHLFRFRRRAGR